MKPTPRPSYPQLARLFKAYVNQDFDAFGPDPLDAVRAYVADVRPATRAAAAAEVDRLLAATKGEAALDAALEALKCGYLPSAAGSTARAFLRAVKATLTAP